jgi:hypothetical protein
MVVSPSDENVRQLTAQLAQQAALRDELAAKKRQKELELASAHRVLETEIAYQESFKEALTRDLHTREETLVRLSDLVETFESQRERVSRAHHAYASAWENRAARLYDARIIDGAEKARTDYQLSEIARAELSLSEKEVDLDRQLRTLQQEVTALARAAQAGPDRSWGTMSYDALRLKREFDRSALETVHAQENIVVLEEELCTLDAAIVRQDHLMKALRGSPYLKALEAQMTVAFVPYDNLDRVSKDARVYGCYLRFVGCVAVGRVAEVLDGEVSGNHPVRGSQLRGVMLRIELDDRTWARRPVLHIGRAPLYVI